MPPDLQAASAWLRKADNDRQSSKLLLTTDPPLTDTAAFHAQQSVEKLLKAFLTANGVVFEKIHDLEQLLNECASIDSSFQELYDDVEPLTIFAVRFRYPGPADPTLEQVKSAIETVDRVWDAVVARLPPDVQP
jgi:HEPN domain-containing protein